MVGFMFSLSYLHQPNSRTQDGTACISHTGTSFVFLRFSFSQSDRPLPSKSSSRVRASLPALGNGVDLTTSVQNREEKN
jgi:hypothetical protein